MAFRPITLLASLLLYLSGSGLAQTVPNGLFAVTVKRWGDSSPPRYTVVPEFGGAAQHLDCSQLAQVPGWDASHPDEKRPSTLEIAFKAVSDGVSITATVFFGEKFDMNDNPDTLARLPQKSVGTYTARVNGSALLTGMTEVGLQPVTVQVVTADDPGGVHPMFISEVPSVQVELTGQNRENFTLALHNVSARDVTGYLICAAYANNGGRSCDMAKGAAAHPVVIAAGATKTISYFMSHSGRETPNGYVADPDPSVVAVKGVIFSDGGAEGLGVSPPRP
jgi:hypothetical protein